MNVTRINMGLYITIMGTKPFILMDFLMHDAAVVPTKSDSAVIFCLQLLSKTLTLHSI